ncbi:MAG: glutamate racemase [Chitinophagaceae bacterium]|nr:glutamate racemase [Chitinophagaceae bacterium]MCW5904019.1 glutamate racemase [Chitinophagaceae bacterium]
MQKKGAIGIFDSGYGGLTILKEIVKVLPEYNYIYLGDNARTPYGSRSFETVYRYTWQAVQWFFEQGCHLVILACNTASAKALRTIQQNDLPLLQDAQHKRVLGVIRPTAEVIGNFTQSNRIGILGTSGTIQSNSYILEIEKFFPDINVYQQACPMWVPLIENNEHHNKGADYFVKEYIDQLMEHSDNIDTILLACTHYPLLIEKIRKHTPADIKIMAQGEIVAHSLKDYLQRHTAINTLCEKQGTIQFYTTDNTDLFNKQAILFWNNIVHSQQINLSTF